MRSGQASTVINSCRSYGFDPLGLASSVDLRSRFQESELIHSRWAMAGVAGVLAVEILGLGNWITAQQWVSVAALLTTTTAGSANKLLYLV